MPTSIFDYITREEAAFSTSKIRVGDNMEWNFRDHVQLLFHLKNGYFYTGENDYIRAFKNIMEPILELCSWTEDIEVKDIVFFIENERGRILSFLIKKYYEVYSKKYDLDSFIDELIDSDLTYGGVLVQKTSSPKPEVFELNTVAFCDQTDILGSPIGFKHTFSPGALRKMGKMGWGKKENGATISIEDLILLATTEKTPAGLQNPQKNQTPGKQIECSIVRGYLPDHYLNDNNDMEYFCNQVQIVAFYYDKDNNRQGVKLYCKEEDEGNILFFTSNKVYGRALGRGVGERLIHPQLWTNWNEIHKNALVEAGTKIIPWTDDENYGKRKPITDVDNLEWQHFEKGSQVGVLQTASPLNIRIIENQIDTWYQQAQLQGAAFDPILGEQSVSGTTFRGQERTVAQGKGPHNKRKGKRAKFIELIFREMIIPELKKEVLKGQKFLGTLSAEDMQWVADQLAENFARDQQLEAIWNMEVMPDKEVLKQEFFKEFGRKGNKHLIEILKGEFDNVEVKMGINVSGKQKDLVMLTDKLLSVFQFAFANPVAFQQSMQIPALAKAFNDILEYSGLSQSDFYSFMSQNTLPPPMQAPEMQPPMALKQPTTV